MWTPSPDAVHQDERHMAIFAPYLKLDQASWYGICAEAYRLTCSDKRARRKAL